MNSISYQHHISSYRQLAERCKPFLLAFFFFPLPLHPPVSVSSPLEAFIKLWHQLHHWYAIIPLDCCKPPVLALKGRSFAGFNHSNTIKTLKDTGWTVEDN